MIDGKKEWFWEEVLENKKRKGPFIGSKPPPPTLVLAELATNSKTVQTRGTQVSDVVGEGLVIEQPVSEAPEFSIPLSGIDFSFSIMFSSIYMEGHEISLNDINLLSQSPSLPIRSTSS